MSPATAKSVRRFQTALHNKAKKSPDSKFYALYDEVYRKDVLAFAYKCSEANRGVAVVDNRTLAAIEEYGAERWLDQLMQKLKSRNYRPLPVRRVPLTSNVARHRPSANSILKVGAWTTPIASPTKITTPSNHRRIVRFLWDSPDAWPISPDRKNAYPEGKKPW